MTDDRFLLADFIGRQNWPTLSFVWLLLYRVILYFRLLRLLRLQSPFFSAMWLRRASETESEWSGCYTVFAYVSTVVWARGYFTYLDLGPPVPAGSLGDEQGGWWTSLATRPILAVTISCHHAATDLASSQLTSIAFRSSCSVSCRVFLALPLLLTGSTVRRWYPTVNRDAEGDGNWFGVSPSPADYVSRPCGAL